MSFGSLPINTAHSTPCISFLFYFHSIKTTEKTTLFYFFLLLQLKQARAAIIYQQLSENIQYKDFFDGE